MKTRISATSYLASTRLFSHEHRGKALARVAMLLLAILVMLFFASFSAPQANALNKGDVLELNSGCPCTFFQAFEGSTFHELAQNDPNSWTVKAENLMQISS
jgi:hypothetical protein